MIALVALGVLALVGIVASVRDIVTDGHRRVRVGEYRGAGSSRHRHSAHPHSAH